MTRPGGWALFESEGRVMTAIDLAQVKVICIQANYGTGGTDIRLSDGPNAYWISVKNDPMTCIAAIAEARKEVPIPMPPADIKAR